MPATPDDLFAALAALGIETWTVEHPPLYTVEDSKALRGQIEGGHTKNLFLKDKRDNVFLLTVGEDARVDLKTVHTLIGAASKLSFGSADLLMRLWGVTPGAVTAFGAINDREGRVKVILDEALMTHRVINCHPLVNTRTTAIGRDDLVRFLEWTGHAPSILPVTVEP